MNSNTAEVGYSFIGCFGIYPSAWDADCCLGSQSRLALQGTSWTAPCKPAASEPGACQLEAEPGQPPSQLSRANPGRTAPLRAFAAGGNPARSPRAALPAAHHSSLLSSRLGCEVHGSQRWVRGPRLQAGRGGGGQAVRRAPPVRGAQCAPPLARLSCGRSALAARLQAVLPAPSSWSARPPRPRARRKLEPG
ncbi:putative uncharacterized protein ASB16-AS1 [Cavia porcellus]|uniref:putative uncharacterized protein ASB16-AS1 n=1 Tax=Cavia porcellus TaxID=10141 RepID=UPI000661F517|nr:putative uncharacterized protein ASB16-AS1 [Cavia porcellus]